MSNKLWDNPESKYPVDRNCWWISKTGKWHLLKTMNVFHLYHALILIWNHKIPESYELPPYNSYHLVCTRKRRRYLLANIFNELMNRELHLTKDMRTTMKQIAAWMVASQNKEAPKSLY